MTNSINQRLTNVFKLLLEHDLTIISDISIDLRCSLCKDILINACQTVCGCIFCERCINNHKRGGGTCCPGETDECKMDNLSNMMIDHRRNREISRLRVRCSEDGCIYECELIDLETHLQNCKEKKLNCPFNNIGCETDKLGYDRMNEHLQMECYNHSNSLIELIDVIRHDLKELKENREKNKWEMLVLKNNKKKCRRETIILKEKINKMRKESDENQMIVKRLKENLFEKEGQIINLKDSIEIRDQLIESIKAQIDGFEKEKEEMKNELRELNTQIAKVKQYLDVRDAIFVWDIGVINQLNYLQFSAPFYMMNNLYKMGLILIDCVKIKKMSCSNDELTKEYDDFKSDVPNADDALIIDFAVYGGASNADLKWPFTANVTVKLVNLRTVKKVFSVTNECSIDQPNSSDTDNHFVFYKSILMNNYEKFKSVTPFRVECSVEMIA